MENDSFLHENQEFIDELQECAKLLTDKLQGDQFEDASKLIHNMIEARDRHLFTAVGKLTRGLHNSLVNFNVDGHPEAEPPQIEGSEIQDASDRLNYVINMTQAAANKTMDMVEASAPIAMSLGQEAGSLREQWAKLKNREMTPDQFRDLYKRMDDFLEQMGDGTDQLNKNLQDIILEQGFQDLTSQVITRVITLVKDLELSLVSLMRIAAQVEDITGLTEVADNNGEVHKKPVDTIAAEGPQIHAATRADVVSGQDDVDDLLSSLGF